ncbi:hypothetical protein BZG36_01836 [Bifiguratus adelaidae]|uniref:Transglutaminase-like domain-containing protein n=1 Tax=Bifiguratus adelaidae TaxID=1938954 RepID=A0A261Y2C2_9FUNG|nr:hypothetical protein BZG36_01836 [Bifiguratus adelaidae]
MSTGHYMHSNGAHMAGLERYDYPSSLRPGSTRKLSSSSQSTRTTSSSRYSSSDGRQILRSDPVYQRPMSARRVPSLRDGSRRKRWSEYKTASPLLEETPPPPQVELHRRRSSPDLTRDILSRRGDEEPADKVKLVPGAWPASPAKDMEDVDGEIVRDTSADQNYEYVILRVPTNAVSSNTGSSPNQNMQMSMASNVNAAAHVPSGLHESQHILASQYASFIEGTMVPEQHHRLPPEPVQLASFDALAEDRIGHRLSTPEVHYFVDSLNALKSVERSQTTGTGGNQPQRAWKRDTSSRYEYLVLKPSQSTIDGIQESMSEHNGPDNIFSESPENTPPLSQKSPHILPNHTADAASPEPAKPPTLGRQQSCSWSSERSESMYRLQRKHSHEHFGLPQYPHYPESEYGTLYSEKPLPPVHSGHVFRSQPSLAAHTQESFASSVVYQKPDDVRSEESTTTVTYRATHRIPRSRSTTDLRSYSDFSGSIVDEGFIPTATMDSSSRESIEVIDQARSGASLKGSVHSNPEGLKPSIRRFLTTLSRKSFSSEDQSSITTPTDEYPSSTFHLRPKFSQPRVSMPVKGLSHLQTSPARSFSQRLKLLLKPRRHKYHAAAREANAGIMEWSVNRANSLDMDRSLKGVGVYRAQWNPFVVLGNSRPVRDTRRKALAFNESDFTQINNYARNVRQRSHLLTAEQLVKKYLIRPYKHDIHKARAIFIWIAENIAIGAPTNADTESLSSKDWVESAEEVLRKRWCRSGSGFARLFCELAVAAELETVIVYGYLRGPKDTIDVAIGANNKSLHAWNAVKIEGEYRLVDCFLASKFHPDNITESFDPFYFLTPPADFIFTHFPTSNPMYQFLDPPLDIHTFFALPYVWPSYFANNLDMVDFEFAKLDLRNDEVAELHLQAPSHVGIFAHVEATVAQANGNPSSITKRAVAQYKLERGKRICKIKAVLPRDCRSAWLVISAGPRDAQGVDGSRAGYPPAMTFRLTHQGTIPPSFDFLTLYPSLADFYIQTPQCNSLYLYQTYTFRLQSVLLRDYKLAVKSPNGRYHKLRPLVGSVDGGTWFQEVVEVREVGTWSLVVLTEGRGGWAMVASWECVPV